MATRDEPVALGVPNWIELSSTDRAGAWTFYGELFGWQVQDTGAETGHYGIAVLDGREVAGLGEVMPESDGKSAWTTYLATPDVEATAEAVRLHGGRILAGPMDVNEAGRLAIVEDPTGASFGLWQAGKTLGIRAVDEAGALVWSELLTRDPAAARTFYSAVFGHTYQASQMEGVGEYLMIQAPDGGQPRSGLGALDPSASPDTPSHWNVYFGVASVDATANRARDLNGAVLVGPQDEPFGRFAVISDPQGATFCVVSDMESPDAP